MLFGRPIPLPPPEPSVRAPAPIQRPPPPVGPPKPPMVSPKWPLRLPLRLPLQAYGWRQEPLNRSAAAPAVSLARRAPVAGVLSGGGGRTISSPISRPAVCTWPPQLPPPSPPALTLPTSSRELPSSFSSSSSASSSSASSLGPYSLHLISSWVYSLLIRPGGVSSPYSLHVISSGVYRI